MQRPLSSVQSETAYSKLVLWKKSASWGNKQEQAKQKMMQILFNMFEFSSFGRPVQV